MIEQWIINICRFPELVLLKSGLILAKLIRRDCGSQVKWENEAIEYSKSDCVINGAINSTKFDIDEWLEQ